MATCILCGCEVGFLGQYAVHLCSTEQILCKQCSNRYERADELEKNRIWDRMIASPHLRKREQVMEFLSSERENIARRDRERTESKQRLDALTAHMRTILRCCDKPMTYLGPGRYTQGSEKLLTPAYERHICVFECPTCGQIKFFNQDFVPASLREEEVSNG